MLRRIEELHEPLHHAEEFALRARRAGREDVEHPRVARQGLRANDRVVVLEARDHPGELEGRVLRLEDRGCRPELVEERVEIVAPERGIEDRPQDLFGARRQTGIEPRERRRREASRGGPSRRQGI